MPVDVVPLGERLDALDAQVGAVELPAAARAGQRLRMRVLLESSSPAQGRVVVMDTTGAPVASQPVALQAGRQLVEIALPAPEPAFNRSHVRLEVAGDARPENNAAETFAVVAERPRVLLVAGAPAEAEHLERALAAAQMGVTTVAPEALPQRLEELAVFDAVVHGLATTPQLHGYVLTTPRRTAQVILATPEDEPQLAVWQHGLGHAMAWTSDLSARWAADWVAGGRLPGPGGTAGGLAPPTAGVGPAGGAGRAARRPAGTCSGRRAARPVHAPRSSRPSPAPVRARRATGAQTRKRLPEAAGCASIGRLHRQHQFVRSAERTDPGAAPAAPGPAAPGPAAPGPAAPSAPSVDKAPFPQRNIYASQRTARRLHKAIYNIASREGYAGRKHPKSSLGGSAGGASPSNLVALASVTMH
ncbi:MAG TPA: glutamine amidotransferase [Roseiflexaceae bacterium]|nr:glutamine amidotransferase [Roseiflexaceae bacterium]